MSMVMDVDFVGQLVDSMNDAVLQLERAIESKNKVEINKLRVFIFDMHQQISSVLEAKNA
jgi:hypothetical protein|tara:strand:- start:26 stop:205 length:180 start_codon:yes stop_codon:yes gene_type:complete